MKAFFATHRAFPSAIERLDLLMSIESIKAELSETAAIKRLEALFDEGTFTQIAPFAKSAGAPCEAAAGRGEVGGCPVFAFAQNSDICSGAMSKAQAAKLKKLYELALKTGTPVVGIYDSIGARVDQGTELMTAYGELLNLSGKLAGIVPQISVILGPCEGTSALMAATADFVIMSEEGKFTINTNGEGGGALENKKHGAAAIVAKDEFAAIEAAKDLVTMLPSNNLSDTFGAGELPPADNGDIISAFTDGGSFIELYEGYAENSSVGFARIDGEVVGVARTKGGVLDRRDCEKLSRLVRFCDAYSIPVVTLADAKGFGCVKSAAKLTAAYAEATTAKITVITGDAYGAFYMAIAGTGASNDVTYALGGAHVYPVAPEAGIIIMAGDRLKTDKAGREKALAEFRENECSALGAAEMGYIDSAVSKDELRDVLISALDMLAGKRETTLPKKHSTL